MYDCEEVTCMIIQPELDRFITGSLSQHIMVWELSVRFHILSATLFDLIIDICVYRQEIYLKIYEHLHLLLV